jgi:hypothetical protein
MFPDALAPQGYQRLLERLEQPDSTVGGRRGLWAVLNGLAPVNLGHLGLAPAFFLESDVTEGLLVRI